MLTAPQCWQNLEPGSRPHDTQLMLNLTGTRKRRGQFFASFSKKQRENAFSQSLAASRLCKVGKSVTRPLCVGQPSLLNLLDVTNEKFSQKWQRRRPAVQHCILDNFSTLFPAFRNPSNEPVFLAIRFRCSLIFAIIFIFVFIYQGSQISFSRYNQLNLHCS